MVHQFEVTPEEVESLDEHQLQKLVNRLVEIEVSQEGLPVDVVVASDRIYDKDGGIDARIHAPEFRGSEFLPAGSSIWQAKAGKSSWPNYEKELQKERVGRAVGEGKTYVIVLGRQMNDFQYETQRTKLRTALDAIDPDASFELRSASHVAKWTTNYPAVWHLLRRPAMAVLECARFPGAAGIARCRVFLVTTNRDLARCRSHAVNSIALEQALANPRPCRGWQESLSPRDVR